MRISRRINVPLPSMSESTGVLNLPTPNGQASGNISPNTEAAELKKFETPTFPPSPPPDDTIMSFSSDTVDAGSPSIVNHVGHDSGPAKEVRMLFSNRRKFLAVSTQLKQLRKESVKKSQA